MACAPSEDSDQPGHLPSLSFAVKTPRRLIFSTNNLGLSTIRKTHRKAIVLIHPWRRQEYRFTASSNSLRTYNLTRLQDLMESFILKAAAEELGPILTRIFQSSLGNGTVLNDWREALIVPLVKKGDRNIASNYRPLSLTSSRIHLTTLITSLINFLLFSKTGKAFNMTISPLLNHSTRLIIMQK